MDFLDRLLKRSAESEPHHIVRPRPLARFEGPEGAELVRQEGTSSFEAGWTPTDKRPSLQSTSVPDTKAVLDRGQKVRPSPPVDEPDRVREVLHVSDYTRQPIPDDHRAPRPTPQKKPATKAHQQSSEMSYRPTRDGKPTSDSREPLEPVQVYVPIRETILPRQDRILDTPFPLQPVMKPEPIARPSDTDTAPRIKVVIGRIDIHAPRPVVPSQPSLSKPSVGNPRPVRPLSEYLRQRNER